MKDNVKEKYEKLYTEAPVANIEDDFFGYRRNRVLAALYRDGRGKRILDLGAGGGAVSRFFQSLGYDVTAIEWVRSSLEKMRAAGIAAVEHDVEKTPYPFSDNAFDEVFWGDNIEHLFDPESVAREIFRILRPGGRLVLSTPNQGWVINRLYFALMGVPRRTEGHKNEIWNWDHIRYFNTTAMARFLRKCGFVKPRFLGSDQRRLFDALSRYSPSLFSSIMVVEAYKE